jgi:hypothetical protein
MASKSPIRHSHSTRPFRFVSYGVRIEINSNEQEIIDEAEAVSRRSLLGNVRIARGRAVDVRFDLNRTKGGTYQLIQNGERIASGRSRFKFLNFFDSMIRVTVGEWAPDHVFLHAGVVGWRGRALLLPADSFRGKTTLVSELVRNGAEYYSDDFAVIDGEGRVHPFARAMSMRPNNDYYRRDELTVAELGGTVGSAPIPVGLVVFTRFIRGHVSWRPRVLTPGQAVMELIQYALPLRRAPEYSLKVLNSVVKDALSVAGNRGEADKFARRLLRYSETRAGFDRSRCDTSPSDISAKIDAPGRS